MTLVTVTPTGPSGVEARGYIKFTPTTGWGLPTVDNLPTPQTIALVNGTVSTELIPSGIGWAWGVTFQVLGLKHWKLYYVIPDVASVDLAALTPVSIQTLQPNNTGPTPAWYAYVDSIVAGQVGTVTVVTGDEVRPVFESVLWIGGTTQPTNMAENQDIWFKATS